MNGAVEWLCEFDEGLFRLQNSQTVANSVPQPSLATTSHIWYRKQPMQEVLFVNRKSGKPHYVSTG